MLAISIILFVLAAVFAYIGDSRLREAESIRKVMEARIADLKEGGHDIKSEFVKTDNGKHVKAYWLEMEAAQA